MEGVYVCRIALLHGLNPGALGSDPCILHVAAGGNSGRAPWEGGPAGSTPMPGAWWSNALERPAKVKSGHDAMPGPDQV